MSGKKIIEGLEEAVAVATGEKPAARFHHNGHTYVPLPVWQPIETAPRDRSWILLGRFAPGGGHHGLIAVDCWHSPERGDRYVGWGEFNMRYWPPTHWMPLPEPPKGE